MFESESAFSPPPPPTRFFEEGEHATLDPQVLADEQMNNNLRMSGAIALMLKKSKDRRQHEALEAAFKRADANGDGLLSEDEYFRILNDHGIECSHDEIKEIIRLADKDNDGFISREEFLGEAPKRQPEPESAEKRAERAFKVFDKNHDGYVTKDEMLRLCKNLSKEQVDAVFARNDVNHDGKLTRKEFEDFLNVHGKK